MSIHFFHLYLNFFFTLIDYQICLFIIINFYNHHFEYEEIFYKKANHNLQTETNHLSIKMSLLLLII